MQRLVSRIILSLSLGLGSSVIAAPEKFTNTQKTEIQQIVRDYLLEKPEILVEVSQKLQQQQQSKANEQAETAIASNKEAIFDKMSPIVGNPTGKVTIVEFFDYQCIHCKHMAPIMSELIGKDKNVQVLYKELPIFGDESAYAAKAALAANKQQKYQAFHDALMAAPKGLTNEKVLEIAKTTGLDIEKLKKDIASKEVEESLAKNKTLAENLGIMGTPVFIVTSNPPQLDDKKKMVFLPGAVSQAKLQQVVEQVQQ
jgi:protein-disulfide isomerase